MSTNGPKDGTELLIRGRAFARGNLQHRTIRIRGGSISEVLDGELPGGWSPGVSALDLKDDQILVPAAVDALSAMHDWEERLRDTVETVSKAALAGGVTPFATSQIRCRGSTLQGSSVNGAICASSMAIPISLSVLILQSRRNELRNIGSNGETQRLLAECTLRSR